MSSVAGCVLHVACCMLHAVRRMWHAAPCRARTRSQQLCTHARARARNVDARTLSSVWPWPMRRLGAEPRSPCARTVHRPQLPRHTLCTAAAPHLSLQSSFGLQLEKVAVNCNAAEKALLADLTEAHPDASYIDLLRLFKARRSVADGHSWRAWCIVSASRCLRKSARSCRT